MLTTFCLLTSALSIGQSPDRSEWLLVPQYVQGLELVYTGYYTEKKTLAPGVEHKRDYRLETTVLVLEATPRHWDVAIMTVLGLRNLRPAGEPGGSATPASVRLELGEVDRQGRLRGKNGWPLAIPLDGPPTVESGAFEKTKPSPFRQRQPLWPRDYSKVRAGHKRALASPVFV